MRDGSISILAEDVAIANGEDLGARVALVLVLVEEQRDAPLSISDLPNHTNDRHAERSSQEATDVVVGVDVGGDAQKGCARQLLYGSLIPFDHHTLGSIGLEKSKNVWGSVIRVLCGGGSGMHVCIKTIN